MKTKLLLTLCAAAILSSCGKNSTDSEVTPFYFGQEDPTINGRFESAVGALEFFNDGEVLLETSSGGFRGVYEMKGTQIKLFDFKGDLIQVLAFRDKGMTVRTIDGMITYKRSFELDENTNMIYQGPEGGLSEIKALNYQSLETRDASEEVLTEIDVENSPLRLDLEKQREIEEERKMKEIELAKHLEK